MIDYSKAFDKVDITVAMNKLLGMHLRPEILPWICDFLSGRVQCVRHGTTLSDWSPTAGHQGWTSGVPGYGQPCGIISPEAVEVR